jgi:hypothetical protein
LQKIGRKRQLTAQQELEVCALYARYKRVTQRYERLMKKLGPGVIARRYNVSTSTVIDYARGRHKGRANYGLAARSIAQARAA